MTRPPGGVVSWTRGREIVAHTLDFAFVTALLLALVQLFGPQLRSQLGAHGRQVQSFGGGVGLAYVFLQLFPEIDKIPDWLGDHVHIVTLTSFLLFFALEAWLILRYRHHSAPVGEDDASVPGAVFWLHIGVLFFYTSIVMFTLPKDVSEDFLFAAASGLALGMHCVYKDYVLRTHAGSQFQTTGRLLLTAAPLLGWLAHRLYHPPEVVLDMFIAVLAGILMQSVFRDEIPNPDAASVRWIVAGVAAFGVLAFIY
jgi:hypothetical protein